MAMEVLLDAGADVNTKLWEGATVLRQLVRTARDVDKYKEERDLFLLVLRRSVNVETMDGNGNTSVQVAEKRKKMDVVNLIKGFAENTI